MPPRASGPPLRVVIDANVYFIPAVRDFFLNAGWLAGAQLLEIGWSDSLLAEVERNWARVTGPDRSEERWQRFATRFREVFAAGRGESAGPLPPGTRVAPEDQHVVGLALALRSRGIVTLNLRHFPQGALAALGLRVWHPDAFCGELLALDPDAVLAILHHQGATLRRPRSLPATLEALSRTCPHFVSALRAREQSR